MDPGFLQRNMCDIAQVSNSRGPVTYSETKWTRDQEKKN